MSRNHRPAVPSLIIAISSLGLTATFGCNAKPPIEKKAARGAKMAPVAAATASPSLECFADRIRDAPAPFHYSYKKDTSTMGKFNFEADVTADTIEGTMVSSDGNKPIHGVRADARSWNLAVMVLATPLPASTLALVMNSSAVAPAGPETVNGFETTKYTIDTSRDTPADAALIRNVMGAKGFVRGAVWATKDGCMVRFAIDAEQDLRDQSVSKEHYEGAMIKAR